MSLSHGLGSVVVLLLLCTITWGQAAPAGAGMALRQGNDGTVIIEQVMEGGPAAQAGVRAGDLLLAVDGHDVRQIPFDRIPDLVRGPAGSQVMLWVMTPGTQPRQVAIRRAILGPAQPPQPPAPQVPAVQPPAPLAQPGQTDPAQATAPAGGPLRFTRVAVRDPAVFDEEAVVMLIPAGWQMQGRIQWAHQHAVLAYPQIRVSDPQSGTQIDWLPYQNFIYAPNPPFAVPQWGNYQGKLWAAPITDGPAFVQAFWMGDALAHLRNARLVGQQELPQMAASFVQQFGGPAQARGYRLRYAYELNGQPWEEDVVFALLWSGNEQLMHWQVNFCTATRAPRGGLDRMRTQTSAVLASAYYTPTWSANLQVCRDLFRQGILTQMQDTAAFGQLLAQHREHTFRLSQQLAQEREQSAARRAEAQREYLGAIETYRDPYKGLSIELPAGYKDYWVNAKGEYILSDTVGYNPNHGSTEEWKQMPRRDPMNPGG